MRLARAITIMFSAMSFLAGVLATAAYFGNEGDETFQGIVVGLAAAFFLMSLLMLVVNLLGQVDVMSSKLSEIESQLIQMNDRQYKMAQWQVQQSKKSISHD